MELFANDLSIHQQFHDIPSFRSSLRILMAARNSARRFDWEFYCHRAFLNAEPLPGMPMKQALGRLDKDEQRAAASWMTRAGPFWDDKRRHSSDDWLECRGEVVTESAVGEAAYRKLDDNTERGLVSLTPSKWNFSPVEVIWRREDEGLEDQKTALENWWDIAVLKDSLQTAPAPIKTWDDLKSASVKRYQRLTFAKDCFGPLEGIPFAKSSKDSILKLLNILDGYAGTFNESGERTSEGKRIYQDYFTGKNALFSDSSDTEKNDFQSELTFKHPGDPGKPLFCPWHGKERHNALRLHFSWPVRFGEPVYVVYIGKKITRR